MMLKDQIKADMIAAMKAKEADKLGTIRMLQAAIKQKEIDEQIELDDASVLKVIQKMLKQRKDSFTQFTDAGRTELADKEAGEMKVLETYLPEQMSEEEILKAIDAAIASTGAESLKDMGKLMGTLKPQLDGKADMGPVSQLIKQKLS